MSKTEIWKPIPSFDGLYEASSIGRIRSVDRNIIAEGYSGGARSYKGKILHPHLTEFGYQRVSLSKNSKITYMKVHRAVCSAFHGLPPEGHDARHLNGVRTDNRPENLAWGTRKENMADAARHGTILCGERRSNSKLTAKDIALLRILRENGSTYAQLSSRFNVSVSCIQGVCQGKTWGHVT